MVRLTSQLVLKLTLLASLSIMAGCGTTKQSTATEQLLGADAVDRAVAKMDFSAFTGQKVFFNAEYIKNYAGKSYQGIGYVNSEYVISSLRQQMASAGCLLQDKLEDADYVVEARIGTLGQDANEIVYGIPATNALSAASIVSGTPPLPTIPEISVARRKDVMAAVKLAAFAYHRESRRPVWQSGLAMANSTAHDSWILGAGPFERGTIHDRWKEKGTTLPLPLRTPKPEPLSPELAAYSEPKLFEQPKASPTPSASVIAHHATNRSPGPDKSQPNAKPAANGTENKN